jgi:cyclase
MLKVRIIPCLLFKDRTIVKSAKFGDLRMVGDPTTVARVFNQREADELIFLDIMASRENRPLNFKVIEDIAKECFMPLTIGGGIKSLDDVNKLFKIGADKISLNTAAVKNPELITEISNKYGVQAVVVSIDAKKINDLYKVFIMSGTEETKFTPVELARKVEAMGAGEILINSIDNDGMMNGYDLELIKEVSDAVKIPVIAAGGCGKLRDFVDAVKLAGADAVCAASIFYYVGESILTAKKFVYDNGINVRYKI